MKLFRIYNKWVGEYFLITAKNKNRAIEIMDDNYILELNNSKEDISKHDGDTSTVDEFLSNRNYRLSMYESEEIKGDITQEGIIDSFVSIGCN